MKLVEFGIKTFRPVYRHHMRRDFPASERKPCFVITSGMRSGRYRCFGFYDNEDKLCGYCVLLCGSNVRIILLDYFAITPEKRGTGLGTLALDILKQSLNTYDGIILEYENPDDPCRESEQSVRQRREAFYTNKGMRRTAIDLILYEVHYCIGYIPLSNDLSDRDVKASLQKLYTEAGYKCYRFTDSL